MSSKGRHLFVQPQTASRPVTFRGGGDQRIDDLRTIFSEKVRRNQLEIPALPEIVMRLNELVSSPRAGVPDAVKLISHDPQLALRVLRLASSPLYGAAECTDLRRASVRLGLHGLRDLAFAVTMGSVFRCGGLEPRMRHEIRHAYAVACGTLRVCHRLGTAIDIGFVCGLLHDVGRLALLSLLAELGRRDAGWLAPSVVDRALDLPHTAAGKLIISGWQLAPVVGMMALYHHEPQLATGCEPVARAVAIADACDDSAQQPRAQRVTQLACDSSALALKLEEEHLADLIATVDEASCAASSLVGESAIRP